MKECRSCHVPQFSAIYREEMEEIICQTCYERELKQNREDDELTEGEAETNSQPDSKERLLKKNDTASWLNTVWDALHGFREDCIPEESDSAYDEQWDEICTAMAWITEELGLDSSDENIG